MELSNVVVEIPKSFLQATQIPANTEPKLEYEYEIMYSGTIFTVVRCTATHRNEKGSKFLAEAEGVARRSYRDKPNFPLGIEIASGRALKAVKMKLAKKIIHNNFMG